ncbi:uncharacterized protein [Elaeis guineensis]|uniref:CTD small phosphatase-like protein 2 isoform X2 n=1 Tax=Elaeis guineensis var. tenera TaxID=51953 RepID=A0A6I9QVM8_ELAGV|nr:CTD small phosphatase-like protein 2 isoform X2 [Elaeis guineensis]
MPALKMKNKARTDCVGGHNLQTCHKSIKKSKSLQSQVKTLQQAALPDIPTQISHDDSLGVETLTQNIRRTEANDNFAYASAQLINSLSASSDSASTGTKASQFSTSQPILEALFSPVIEANESQFKPVNHVRDDEHGELPSLIANDKDNGNNESEVQTANFWDLYTSEKDSYVVLPFFEKTVETITSQDPLEEPTVRSDGSYLYLAIHQLKSSDQETESSYNLEETECFDPQYFFKSLPDLPDLSEAVSSISPAFLPKEIGRKKSVTLVLDLDETLVHSTLEHCDDADFTFPVFFNMKQHTVYVRRRPYLQIFLEKVAQMFEIVIFTASQSIYAEQLLNILDPDRKLISRRIYRESCIFSGGSYTKDLTILGVDLAKVAIIDNSPQVFQLQVNNGIPIKSWFDDPSDHALISLIPFLETLVDAEDVRPIIAKKFGNKE